MELKGFHKLSFLAICLTAISVLMIGCGNNEKLYSEDFLAMDTYMEVKAYGSKAENAIKDVKSMIYEAQDEFDTTKQDSDISLLNSEKHREVKGMLKDAILAGEKYSKLTDHYLDITIEPVVDIWGFNTGKTRFPSKTEINSAKKKVDYNNLIVKNNNDGSVSLELKNDAEITLGAVAKGYCTEKAVEIFKKYNVKSGLINLGGNIYAYGDNLGQPWKIGVDDPYNPESTIGYVKAENISLVTSGDYQRYFEVDGVRYHHIMDYRTGMPARSGLRQCTIVTKSATMGDCLSTALFVMGKDKAIEYYKKHSNEMDIILVTDDKKVYYTKGLKGLFVNTSDLETQMIGEG